MWDEDKTGDTPSFKLLEVAGRKMVRPYQEVCVINVQCVKWLFLHFSLKSVWLPAFL